MPALLLPASGRAATIVVRAGGDTSLSQCTLRHAALSIIAGADTGGCEATGLAYGSSDTIEVAAAGGPTIQLAAVPVTIQSPANLTIKGPGASALDVQGGATFSVFEVFTTPGLTVTISGLTVSGGHSVSSTVAQGGGINVRSETHLVLDHVVVTENAATVNATTGAPNALGGGIYSTGPSPFATAPSATTNRRLPRKGAASSRRPTAAASGPTTIF